jgi:ribonucleoside-diphosphate reductase beta chain
MYLSRQLYEEALHVEFYLTLLDTYLPDHKDRERAFSAIQNIPSIKRKAEFCFKWIDSINKLETLKTKADRRQFLLNLICFASCIEGLFFFAAFAYVYFYRSRGFLQGLATGTNWVFRDESQHLSFALSIVNTVKSEEPDLFDADMKNQVRAMMAEAIECEALFAEDLLTQGVIGLSPSNVKQYLQYIADNRFQMLGMDPVYKVTNPFPFMAHQDVQEHTNFFERRVSSYQMGVEGSVVLDGDF